MRRTAQAAVNWSPDRDDGSALDRRIGVATAVGALLASDPDNAELRSLLLRAAAKGTMKVGASDAWFDPRVGTRPRLALNVFFLLVEAALRDGDGGVPDDLVAVYEAAERNAALGPVPDVRACSTMAMYRLERVLPALPVYGNRDARRARRDRATTACDCTR